MSAGLKEHSLCLVLLLPLLYWMVHTTYASMNKWQRLHQPLARVCRRTSPWYTNHHSSADNYIDSHEKGKRRIELGHEKEREREISFLCTVPRQHLCPGNYCILTESTFAKEGLVIMSETFIIPTTPFITHWSVGWTYFHKPSRHHWTAK